MIIPPNRIILLKTIFQIKADNIIENITAGFFERSFEMDAGPCLSPGKRDSRAELIPVSIFKRDSWYTSEIPAANTGTIFAR